MAPVTRRSDTSIRDEFPARSGNKHLKRSLFLSGFAALRSDPVTRSIGRVPTGKTPREGAPDDPLDPAGMTRVGPGPPADSPPSGMAEEPGRT